MTSNLKALGGCSSHHLQGAGVYYGGSTTGRTACCNLISEVADEQASANMRRLLDRLQTTTANDVLTEVLYLFDETFTKKIEQLPRSTARFAGGRYNNHSTSIRLQFDRSTTIRRPALRPHNLLH